MEQEQQGERSFVWYCDIVVRGPSHLGGFLDRKATVIHESDTTHE